MRFFILGIILFFCFSTYALDINALNRHISQILSIKNFDQAEIELQRAFSIEGVENMPEYSHFLFYQSILYMERENLQEAQKYFEEAIKKEQHVLLDWYFFGGLIFFKSEQYALALNYFKKNQSLFIIDKFDETAEQKNEEEANIFVTAALKAFHLSRHKDAQLLLSHALERDPGSFYLFEEKALIADWLKSHPEEGMKYIEKAFI